MKKKAIISIMLVFVILISSIPAFADTPIPAIPTDAWEYWAVVERVISRKTYFYLVSSHNPIKADSSGTLIMNNSRLYVFDGNDWIFENEYYSGVSVPTEKVYAASHNIAYTSGSGFFFTVPSQSPLYLTLKRMDFGTILRTFSAGLIPLLGCVILVISLMKGLAYLRSQLMR